jgi:hypothetical protein
MDEAKRIMEEFIKKNAEGITSSVGVSDRILHI